MKKITILYSKDDILYKTDDIINFIKSKQKECKMDLNKKEVLEKIKENQRKLEQKINHLLTEFTKENEVAIDDIIFNKVNINEMGDLYNNYCYMVETRIYI